MNGRTIIMTAMVAVVMLMGVAAADVDIYVNKTGWWNAGGGFTVSSTPIQHAIDHATAGNTIYVYNGTYNESVVVGKQLTLVGEGADVVNVNATSGDYVFEVTADYVNISGFNVTGATGIPPEAAGIYLNGVGHCNISDNTASNNDYGIRMGDSNNNTLTGNTASNNYLGIRMGDSNNNTLTGNTANLNNACGIELYSSNNNRLTNNTHLNTNDGIRLTALSNNNTLTNNTANSNANYGIRLSSSNNNTLTNNTANLNTNDGIWLDHSSNNTLTNNTANLNTACGIRLTALSNNNTLTNNTASDNGWDIYIDDSPSTFTGNTLSGINVSFTYSGGVSLKGEGSPAADPSGRQSIGKFINATNYSAGTWLYLNFSYSDADVSGLNESSLAVWKYNGTTWFEDGWNGTRYLSTANNTVGVNITTFSVFAPMVSIASVGGGSRGGSGGNGTYPPGWFDTPTPTVTAMKALAASANATSTPPADKVTSAPTKAKPATTKTTAPAAEGTTAGDAKKGAPGFTAVFVIAGMLAVAYAMMRRRE